MNDPITFPDLVRGVLIAASLVIALGFANRIFRSHRWESSENKFLHWGALLSIVAMAGRSFIAVQNHDRLVWPLIFYAAALAAFAAYLTSPRGRVR